MPAIDEAMNDYEKPMIYLCGRWNHLTFLGTGLHCALRNNFEIIPNRSVYKTNLIIEEINLKIFQIHSEIFASPWILHICVLIVYSM